ncbi:unnamed protein product [Alopecurus aequalis]
MDEVWKDMSLASTPPALHYSLSPAAYGDLTLPQPPRTPPPPATLTPSGATGLASNPMSSGDDSGLLRMPDLFAFPDKSANVSSSSSNRRVAVQRRIMKNRESAVRSRARKQAYADEMEQELEQLKRDNTMLIKREQDFHARMVLAVAQAPGDDRSALHRCRSAPPL